MTITADELARIRTYVPTTWTPSEEFDDAAITAVWDREADISATEGVDGPLRQSWANVYLVALNRLDRMIAGMVGEPDSFSVGGEYSESRGAAINMLMNLRTTVAGYWRDSQAVFTGTNQVVFTRMVRQNGQGR